MNQEIEEKLNAFEEAIRRNERLKIARDIYLGIEAAQALTGSVIPAVAISVLRDLADGLAEL